MVSLPLLLITSCSQCQKPCIIHLQIMGGNLTTFPTRFKYLLTRLISASFSYSSFLSFSCRNTITPRIDLFRDCSLPISYPGLGPKEPVHFQCDLPSTSVQPRCWCHSRPPVNATRFDFRFLQIETDRFARIVLVIPHGIQFRPAPPGSGWKWRFGSCTGRLFVDAGIILRSRRVGKCTRFEQEATTRESSPVFGLFCILLNWVAA